MDFDHSLHNAVGRIREVLGDSAENPRYIETLPRRGYRFIAKVEDVRAAKNGVAAYDEKSEAKVAVVSQDQRRGMAILLLCACVAIGLSGWLAWRHFYLKNLAPIRSIAVLPMENFSGDASQEYFADGMTEELITELSRIQSVKVISRTSVMGYKGSKKRLPQIAQELGVDQLRFAVHDRNHLRWTWQ